VALDVDLVAATVGAVAAEEVVEPHLVQRRGRGVGGDVPTNGDPGPLRPVHHHRGVPPDVGTDPALELLVAGKRRFGVRGDGVDVVGSEQVRHVHLSLARSL
jgi:hypothetical protein